MKIALLSEKYTPDIGGLAISAARLGSLLASAGHQVLVFAPGGGLLPAERRTLDHAGVCITRFGLRKRLDDTLVDWFELVVEEHRRAPFDILHAYFLPQAGFVAAYAGNYLGVPAVVSARGNDLERAVFAPDRAAHVLYALERADAITTNAAGLARKARALVPGREIVIIPNGVDSERFIPLSRTPALADHLGLKEVPVIGFAGELREKKGLSALLNGFAQIAARQPAALLIVGDLRPGEDRQFLEEFRVSHRGLPIIVTGHVPHADIPAFYALMDVFVHPSLRDGLPNALLEAMACERPIVATAVGGAIDVITDGVEGRLVPPGDPEALAAGISGLLKDRGLAARLGKNARERVLRNHRLSLELDTNLALYERLAQR